MSLSRKLIERLISEEIESKGMYEDFDKDLLMNLSHQIFSSHITQTDRKEQKKSIQDKVEHFHFLMENGDLQ